MSVNITIRQTGPIFLPGAPDVVKRNLENAVRELVEQGEERLAGMLRPRPAGVYLSINEARPGRASTGHYRRNLSSTVKELNGRISDGGVVYGPWLEGVSSRNGRTRFKGYASFRRVGEWLNKRKRGVVSKHILRALRRLT